MKCSSASRSSTYKFFQKKKKKKRKPFFQVEGFKKAGFFEKILPDKVEIFSKTRRAWTCFFVNLELTFADFFFIFYFVSKFKMLLFNRDKSEGMSVELEEGRLWKGFEILRDGWKNQIKYWKCFSSGTEILYSFLHFLIFEDA